jgi:hypothetical protein
VWFTTRLLLGTHELSTEEENTLLQVVAEVRVKLEELDRAPDDEALTSARKMIQDNPHLEELFQMMWVVVSPYLDPSGSLTEEGYVKFNVLVQHSLLGETVEKDECECLAKADYDSDKARFGKISKNAFYHILYELIGL